MIIHQPSGFKFKDDEDMLSKKDELAEWLFTESVVPLQFDDEPGRTYHAVVQNSIDDFSRFADLRQGTIQFLVPDGYGYGEEKTSEFQSDSIIVNNKGTAEADPIFELTAKKKATFAMISNGSEEYNLIGTPADDDVQEVDVRTTVLYENGSTLDQWQHTNNRGMIADDSNIDSLDGELGTDGAGIRIERNGTPRNGQRGGAIFRELDTAIQDFEIESTFDIISRRDVENFRTMIYFLDENMNNIGHIGIKDNSRNQKRRVPLAQLGMHNRGVGILGDSSMRMDNAPDTTLFYLRVKREGKRFNFYIGFWRNNRHEIVWNETFNDVNNEFQGRLKYITLFIGTYQDRPTPNRNRINSVEVFELSQATVDQTPYILYPGDVVLFDHKNDDILVNGEPRNDLKNFGGSFFKLKKGENMLTVTPENVFDTKVTFRDKFR